MASSIIRKVIPTGGSGYCKLPDGTMICWGLESKKSGDAVSFAQTFYSPPVVFVDPADSNSNNVFDARASARTTSGFTLHCARTSTGGTTGEFTTTINYIYLAVGRWKA